jgi:cell division protein FtsA
MVLSVGGSHLTSDIAHGLRLPADMAEKAKIEHGHAVAADGGATDMFVVQPFGEDRPVQLSRNDLATIIEARVEEMFGLVLQEIKRTGYDGLLPAGIVLTGGSSLLPGLRKAASNVLNLPCRVAAPPPLVGLADALNSPAYATSVGLLHWAQRESLAAAAHPKKKKGRAGAGARSLVVDLGKGLDILKRLLP